jgi:alkylation response protein AidB-like acyl-CoA dehydrogenase
MNFSLSREQLELRKATIEFARSSLAGGLVERDRRKEFSRELWNECARFGIQGLPFPKEHGGGGLDIVTTVCIMEALGYACRDNGLIFGINAQMWSVQMPIFRHGSDDQRRKYLPGLCDGTLIGAHGMTEPDSGSDAFALRMTAEPRGGGYVLNGTKTFVSNADAADVFLIFANVGAAMDPLGITGFLLDRDTAGLRVSRPIEKMGLRTCSLGEVALEDCRVSSENRLGREGRGGQIFNDSMEWERSCILAGSVGAMERQLESCLEYARTRRQFGKPIGKFQSISNRLVAMKLRHETARLLLYKAAWTKQESLPVKSEASMAKLYISQALLESCLDAVQIHGGYGYTTEFELERDLRDAVGSTLYSGTSEIQKLIIARDLRV